MRVILKKKSNLVLIGFMGSGKGNLARHLHRHFNRVTLDTDELIENMAHKTIREIFEQDGEQIFRRYEQQIVDWINIDVDHTIISAGGGMPIHTKNFEYIGQVIYLHSDFDFIYTRLQNSRDAENKLAKRPLLQDPSQARQLLEAREPLYTAKADLILDIAKLTREEVMARIKGFIT